MENRKYGKRKCAGFSAVLTVAVALAGLGLGKAHAVEINWGTVVINPWLYQYGGFDSDGNTPLANGDILQLIYAGEDDCISPPNGEGFPTGDDQLIEECIVGWGGYPDGYGFFSCNTSWIEGIINTGMFVYVRAYNDSTIAQATHYGDSVLREYAAENGDSVVDLTFQVTNAVNTLTADTELSASPPAIVVASLEATGITDGVRIDWITTSEADVQGFNIYTTTDPEGEYVQINEEMIPGQGSAEAGASYEYADMEAVSGMENHYLLESIDGEGGYQLHGPVSAIPVETPAQKMNIALTTPEDEADEDSGKNSFDMEKLIPPGLEGAGCGGNEGDLGLNFLPLAGIFLIRRRARAKRNKR